MRRWSIVPLLLSVVTLVPAAHAAPSPQLRDPKGDWQVPAQDVLSGRVSSRWVGGKPVLRGELTLAEAPSAVPTTYTFSFASNCSMWAFVYDSAGSVRPATARLEHSVCGPITNSPTTSPVVATVKGTTIVWETPYVTGIRRGLALTSFAALGGTVPTGVAAGDTITGYHEAFAGDIAYGNLTYVVGSDLPRR